MLDVVYPVIKGSNVTGEKEVVAIFNTLDEADLWVYQMNESKHAESPIYYDVQEEGMTVYSTAEEAPKF